MVLHCWLSCWQAGHCHFKRSAGDRALAVVVENPCSYLVNDLQGRELRASPAAGGTDLPWQGGFVVNEKCHRLLAFSCVVVLF